jgi:transcriptional regulator of arginine metabolism
MKVKNNRIETLKMLISSKELGSQEELLQELKQEGFQLTQATLSRDLKQLKVAKAASMNGKYVYVLPNETMYKRVRST